VVLLMVSNAPKSAPYLIDTVITINLHCLWLVHSLYSAFTISVVVWGMLGMW
jgi:hypothetical protein